MEHSGVTTRPDWTRAIREREMRLFVGWKEECRGVRERLRLKLLTIG